MSRHGKGFSWRKTKIVSVATLMCSQVLAAFAPSANGTEVPSALTLEATVMRISPDAVGASVARPPMQARLYLGPSTMTRGGWVYALYDDGIHVRAGYVSLTSLGGISEYVIDLAAVTRKAMSVDVTTEQITIVPKALQMKCTGNASDARPNPCSYHYVLNTSAPVHFSGYVRAHCEGTLVLSKNTDIETTHPYPHTHDALIPVGGGVGVAVEVVPLKRSVAENFPRRLPSSSITCTVIEVRE